MNPSYKTFFLGPKSENEEWARTELQSILNNWFTWRKSLFPLDKSHFPSEEKTDPRLLEQQKNLSKMLARLNDLLKAEVPTYTPRYIGHMVSEISLPAILGHFATLLHNPNNTSKEVSRIGAVIEREAISMLAEMIGYDPIASKGHFTCGGTIANFEAVWRARFRFDHWMSLALYLAERHKRKLNIFEAAHMGWKKFSKLIKEYNVSDEQLRQFSAVVGNPYKIINLISKHISKDYLGPVVLVPGSKHFSWQKAVNIFGLGEESFWTIPLNKFGKPSLSALQELIERAKIESRPILMIVSIAGTTETGVIDPITETQQLIDDLLENESLDIWHHIDAAYGGFMCSLLHNHSEQKAVNNILDSLQSISKAHSVTLDPHKLGYVPYSCGAFLTKDELCYSVSSFKAPYLDRPKLGGGKWSSTIEGSRTASGAAATWLTGKTIGFTSKIFSDIIQSTFESCHYFKKELQKQLPWIHFLEPTETNILCFSVANKNDSLTVSNKKTQFIYDSISKSPNFSSSNTTLSLQNYEYQIKEHLHSFHGELDTDHLVLIRCVFMNPFWAEESVKKTLIPEFIEELKSYYEML